MRYLLSNNGFILFKTITFTFATTPIIFTLIYVTSKISINSKSFLTTLLIVLILSIIGIELAISTKEEITYESNWKQIYTNENNNNIVENKPYGTYINNGIEVIITNNIRSEDIVAGAKLGDNYKLFLGDSKAEIKIEKDDTSYSKKIKINKNNVIINNEINEDSIITKIEYRAIKGIQRSLFGYKGPIEKSNLDGELRITIENNPKQQELKQIFDSQT